MTEKTKKNQIMLVLRSVQPVSTEDPLNLVKPRAAFDPNSPGVCYRAGRGERADYSCRWHQHTENRINHPSYMSRGRRMGRRGKIWEHSGQMYGCLSVEVSLCTECVNNVFVSAQVCAFCVGVCARVGYVSDLQRHAPLTKNNKECFQGRRKRWEWEVKSNNQRVREVWLEIHKWNDQQHEMRQSGRKWKRERDYEKQKEEMNRELKEDGCGRDKTEVAIGGSERERDNEMKPLRHLHFTSSLPLWHRDLQAMWG